MTPNPLSGGQLIQDHRTENAYWALRLTFGVVPIVAGLDKFTNLLADWTAYLLRRRSHPDNVGSVPAPGILTRRQGARAWAGRSGKDGLAAA